VFYTHERDFGTLRVVFSFIRKTSTRCVLICNAFINLSSGHIPAALKIEEKLPWGHFIEHNKFDSR
jgi:hypothetical protein